MLRIPEVVERFLAGLALASADVYGFANVTVIVVSSGAFQLCGHFEGEC